MLVCEVELDLIWKLNLKLKLKLMTQWMILNLVELDLCGFDLESLVNRVERDTEGCSLVEVELQF